MKTKTQTAKPTPDHKTPMYKAWSNMVQKCTNPKHPGYKNGDQVSDTWVDSFKTFKKDMPSRPENSTLGRRDIKKPYNASNCIWIAASDRKHSARVNTINVTYDGRVVSLQEAATLSGIGYQTLYQRYQKHGEGGLFRPSQKLTPATADSLNYQGMK